MKYWNGLKLRLALRVGMICAALLYGNGFGNALYAQQASRGE